MNNSQVLKDTDLCRSCGKCCRHLVLFFDNEDGTIDRFNLLKTNLITTSSDGKFPDGKDRYKVVFNTSCSKLTYSKKEGLRCSIYHQKRPWMCEHYPFKGQPNECPKAEANDEKRKEDEEDG